MQFWFRQDEEVLPYSLSTADVGLVSLEVELTGLAVPSKAFYFLAAETPLIVLCNRACELADVVEEFGCGAVVEPGDVNGLFQVLTNVLDGPDLLDQWKMGAHRASIAHSRSQATGRISELLRQKLVGPTRGA